MQGLIGTLSTAHTADTFGRRMAMFIGATFSWVGGGLQAGSVHIAMFMIARFITGVGIGMLLCLVPLYQSELAPPKIRGLLVGTHGVMLCVGYSLASWLGVAFYFVQLQGAQWRIPLAIQAIFPLLLCSGVLKVPESPRYCKILTCWTNLRTDADWKAVSDSPRACGGRVQSFHLSARWYRNRRRE